MACVGRPSRFRQVSAPQVRHQDPQNANEEQPTARDTRLLLRHCTLPPSPLRMPANMESASRSECEAAGKLARKDLRAHSPRGRFAVAPVRSSGTGTGTGKGNMVDLDLARWRGGGPPTPHPHTLVAAGIATSPAGSSSFDSPSLEQPSPLHLPPSLGLVGGRGAGRRQFPSDRPHLAKKNTHATRVSCTAASATKLESVRGTPFPFARVRRHSFDQ